MRSITHYKTFGNLLLILMLCGLFLAACGTNKEVAEPVHTTSTEQPTSVEKSDMAEKMDSEKSEDQSASEDNIEENMDLQEGTDEMGKLIIEVNGHRLVATLAENSSVDALKELLAEGPVTIDMHDFSNFEKVGELPVELPTNDEQISTDYGDLILYLGKRFVIYYDKNSWDFTRLGHIDDITQDELKSILGDGNVTATLSLGE